MTFGKFFLWNLACAAIMFGVTLVLTAIARISN